MKLIYSIPDKLYYIQNFLDYSTYKKLHYDVFKSKLVDYIFKKIITKNNTAFAKNIYLKKSHIIEMNSDKMHFGTHSSSHLWLGKNTKIKQERDIKKSIYDLQKILGKNEILSICYPFGSYNKETISTSKCGSSGICMPSPKLRPSQ